MTKQEVKETENHTLIKETINTYAMLLVNFNLGRGTKQLESHFQDCCAELVKRELITQDDWDDLNR